MIRFILDTDHLSLFQRSHTAVTERVKSLPPEVLAITIVTVEEQLRGRLAQIKVARNAVEFSLAYQRLNQAVEELAAFTRLPYDEAAHHHFLHLKSLKLRVGTQDLRIAAIALARDCALVTRNTQDFQAIPRLTLADWSR